MTLFSVLHIRLDIYITIIFYAHFLTLFEEKNPINQSRFLCCKFSIYWVVVNSGKVLGIYCKSSIQSIGKHKYYLTSTSRYIFTLPNCMYNDTKYTFQYISVAPTNYVHYFVCVVILSLFYFVFFISWTQLKTKIVSLSAQKEEMCDCSSISLEVYSQTCTRSILFGEWFSSWPQWKGRLISRRAS